VISPRKELEPVAEAVSWNHASQPDQPRQGQRVVIFPKYLTQMDEFLNTCETDDGQGEGHEAAYNSILENQAKYGNTPIIVNESSTYVTTDPVLSQCVPTWMSMAEQIATGCRHRALEDGRDVMNSDEEDDEHMVPDKLTGVYTAEMLGPDGKPKAGLPKLSSAEANRQRAAAKAAKASKAPTVSQSVPAPSHSVTAPPHSLKPLPSCLADAEEEYPPDPTIQAPAKGLPLDIQVTSVPAVGISKGRTKAAATQQAPAGKSGSKAETQESTPMVTRSRKKKASRAGGLRGVDGLGQTETGVLQVATPSKT
jgi:hypothetical protein